MITETKPERWRLRHTLCVSIFQVLKMPLDCLIWWPKQRKIWRKTLQRSAFYMNLTGLMKRFVSALKVVNYVKDH